MLNDFEDITTVEAAFKRAGRPLNIDLTGIPEDLRAVFRAFYELVVVTESLNMNSGLKWCPDYNLTNTVMDDKYLMVVDFWRKKFIYHGFHKSRSLLDLSHSKPLALRSLGVVEHFSKYFLNTYGKFMLTSIKDVDGVV